MAARDPVVQRLQEEIAKLEGEYSELLKTFKPGYPECVRLRARIDQLGQTVATRMQEWLRAAGTQYAAAEQRVAALREVSWVVIDRVRGMAADHGWGSGMRAQPGQEGWSILQQRAIFGHLPVDEIGVRLSDSCLMIPQKSVSFAIGMGPGMRPDVVACDFCSRRERCHWRVRA